MRRQFFARVSLLARALLLTLAPLLLLVACRRPEVDAFAKRPLPIVVGFEVFPGVRNREAVKGEYAAALRARLATCAMVVPEGEAAPSQVAALKVDITQIHPHSDPSPAAIGTATGIAVGTLSAMAGNRDAFFDGLFWGLWTGSMAADAQHYDQSRLGYWPVRVSAVVKLEQPGCRYPLLEFTVGGREVIERMAPLGPGDRYDEARIREEEAKAFADLVVTRIQERFHWMRLPEPSYYKAPAVTDPAKE